jgi:hypothetical protein
MIDNLSKVSDDNLFNLCKKYGHQARFWRQKFAGLLPEVNKRRLYEKKGFKSIFVFAKILAGLSEEQVRRVLNMERSFEDKPRLQTMLINGEVSINKLAKIVSIATPANDEFLANQVQFLSTRDLETLARDGRNAQKSNEEISNVDGSQQPLFDPKSVHVNTNVQDISSDVKLMTKLSPEIKKQLLELSDKGIDIDDLIAKMLATREAEIAEKKSEAAEEIAEKKTAKKPSRYIPVKIKKIIKLEQGTKCSITACRRPAEQIHHSQRFSVSQNHDPHFLAQLCKEHHKIAHAVDVKVQEIRNRKINSA